jgi:hypothetical protein
MLPLWWGTDLLSLVCAGNLLALSDALDSLVIATNELRKLGQKYEVRLAELLKEITECMIIICGVWHDCASRVTAKCCLGERHLLAPVHDATEAF